MFYVDECVRSPRYGLGVVIWAGDDPWVQFLAGERLQVEGSALRVVPDEVYDAEVANRARLERWLTWRVTGMLEPEPKLVSRPRTDLEGKLHRSAEQSCLPYVDVTPLPLFTSDDVNPATQSRQLTR